MTIDERNRIGRDRDTSATVPAMPATERAATPLVVPLRALTGEDLPLAGGKAVNLGRLHAAGLPVPDGFCLTTAAYAEVAASADIAPLLDKLAVVPAKDAARLREAAGQIAARLLAAPVPAAIERAIRAAAATVGVDTPVAVRSSATAEDLPYASFAGQQETILHVVGEEALLAAVRRCWASLWTERAVAYRARNGIDPRTVRLAVVVQRMIAAEAAGVLFTANPVTGNRGQMVVDASFGLGEAVVSGAVNPDHFVLDAATGSVRERRLGDKRVSIVPTSGGGTQRVETDAADDRSALSDDQLRELAALGRRAAAHFGVPQDIEFAVDAAGAVWIVQSRPITTLYPLPAEAPRDLGELRVYFSINVAQGVFRPLTPMGRQALQLVGASMVSLFGVRLPDPVAGPVAMVEAAGRLFVDITGALRSGGGRRFLAAALGRMEARSAAGLQALFADPRLAVRPGSRREDLSRVAAFVVNTRLPLRLGVAALHPPLARRWLARLEWEMRQEATPGPEAPIAARLDALERDLLTWPRRIMAVAIPVLLAGIGAFAAAERLLGDLASAEERDAVKRAVPHNPTIAMDLRLNEIARRAGDDPAAAAALEERASAELAQAYAQDSLPAALQADLAIFLARYGHRAAAEIDLGLPRWGEDPAPLFVVLANHRKLEPGRPAPDARFRAAAAAAEATVHELATRAGRHGRWRGWAVRFLLERGRELVGLREVPKFLLVLLLARARAGLLTIGEDLARWGRLNRGDDVFFLTLPEVRRAAAGAGPRLRGLVRERRTGYELELRRTHVPRLLLSDGTDPAPSIPDAPDQTSVLRGTAASAGQVSGVARVVLDPAGADLEPGDILVAPSTDPGWTPLFLTAGGLVMEMGGAMSHGAVVAREYGIPAVVGVPGATSRIRDGQQVAVDGAAGTVDLSPQQLDRPLGEAPVGVETIERAPAATIVAE